LWQIERQALAQKTIMDAHDPEFDTAYRVDADSGRVDDSLDKCPGTLNPDQLDADDDGIDDLWELPRDC
jgi:hypothetical protein